MTSVREALAAAAAEVDQLEQQVGAETQRREEAEKRAAQLELRTRHAIDALNGTIKVGPQRAEDVEQAAATYDAVLRELVRHVGGELSGKNPHALAAQVRERFDLEQQARRALADEVDSVRAASTEREEVITRIALSLRDLERLEGDGSIYDIELAVAGLIEDYTTIQPADTDRPSSPSSAGEPAPDEASTPAASSTTSSSWAPAASPSADAADGDRCYITRWNPKGKRREFLTSESGPEVGGPATWKWTDDVEGAQQFDAAAASRRLVRRGWALVYADPSSLADLAQEDREREGRKAHDAAVAAGEEPPAHPKPPSMTARGDAIDHVATRDFVCPACSSGAGYCCNWTTDSGAFLSANVCHSERRALVPAQAATPVVTMPAAEPAPAEDVIDDLAEAGHG